MSWSVSFIGTPDKIVEALDKECERMSGMSRNEYEAALPHLKSLVQQNMNTIPENAPPMLILNAAGHGYNDHRGEYRSCHVKLESIYGVLV